MAISKKARRSINYNGKKFLWWVDPEFDDDGSMLSVTIASEDKKFLIEHFLLPHDPEKAYVSVVGEYFPGLEQKTGNAMKIPCPDFRDSLNNNAVTPQTIKDVLDWCFSGPHCSINQKL